MNIAKKMKTDQSLKIKQSSMYNIWKWQCITNLLLSMLQILAQVLDFYFFFLQKFRLLTQNLFFLLHLFDWKIKGEFPVKLNIALRCARFHSKHHRTSTSTMLTLQVRYIHHTYTITMIQTISVVCLWQNLKAEPLKLLILLLCLMKTSTHYPHRESGF